MRSILLISIASLLLTAHASASDLRHVEDASLRSVFFIDHKEGWVVGDEGLILHTLNGGKTWQRQQTGVRGSLRSVHFLTPEVGWVVGREELPYGMGSAGIVLFTDDGGLTWKRQLANTLPGLNQVRFVDAKTGFLFGDGSEQFPFGAFKTTDSGRSWEPIPGPRTTSWLAGDFYDGNSGILAGAWSRLAIVRKDKAVDERATGVLAGGWSQLTVADRSKASLADHADWLAGRDITALQILGRKTVAVGQGGLVLSSVSGGSAWGLPEKVLATDVLANLDFHALTAVRDKVWVVGRPGSVVLHSSDGGAKWSLHKTGQRLPLHGVFFFDEKHGWAVGDAGTILHSLDGGKSWTTLHQAGKRAAVMAIHSLNKNAPVDTLTYLGAAEGYLTTSLRITAPDANTIAWGREKDARRYAAAMRAAGALTGETLWHFPMPQHLQGCDKKTILAHWNQLHAKRADEELIRQLTLSLRVWRPDVIVSEHPASKVALSSLLGEAVEEAVHRAADAKAFPEQIEELGLSAWTVRKVYGLGDESSRELKRPEGPTLTQDNDEPKTRLQMTVRDYAAAAHSLLTARSTQLPRERTHYLLTAAPKATAERHWLEGIEAKAGETRRDIPLEGKMDAKLQQALSARRAVIDLAENLEDPARTMSLLPIALDKMPEEQAAPAAFTIAGSYAERGQWYFAQEMYLYLVDRFPAHPLSAEGYRWLIRLNTSSEARRRHELKHFAIAEPIGVAKKGALTASKEKVIRAGFVDLAATTDILEKSGIRDWNKGAPELMKRLSGYGSIYSYEPATQFCLQSAKRQLGDVGASNSALEQFRKVVPSGPCHDAAKAELWLTERGANTPRRLSRARYTEVRPYLDGKLDDPCWQGAKPMLLDNAVGDTTKDHGTEAFFAFDQEFLYVALRCTHPAGQQVAPLKPRPRDADMEPYDRVSILLDLDRDYATYHHLEVDQRGCVRDRCCGDKSWNPRWFVAVHSTETCWQIEAAIPLSELTGDRITQNTAWAFNVVRTVPGRGVQSWSLPADVEPRPEGMSLLLFQTGAARPMMKEP